MSQHKSKEFKALEREWYQKLKDNDFEDIEDLRNEKRLLKCWHSFQYQRISKVKWEAIKIYYEKAAELLLTYVFTTERHKMIWEMHCQGMTCREISDQLLGCPKSTVSWTIIKIAKEIK